VPGVEWGRSAGFGGPPPAPAPAGAGAGADRARTDGAALEDEVAGTGEPVVCIHGAFFAATFRPLLAEPDLAGRYRLIRYRRRGDAGSRRGAGRGRPSGCSPRA
jgi:pimeloyl-ACP methyl ester carboxylesterase